MPTLTLAMGVDLSRKIEPTLASNGYHCALTGSLLFKGESQKDADVILYPHNPGKTLTRDELLKVLESAGVILRAFTNDESGNRNREVAVCGHQDQRVDLFIFQS